MTRPRINHNPAQSTYNGQASRRRVVVHVPEERDSDVEMTDTVGPEGGRAHTAASSRAHRSIRVSFNDTDTDANDEGGSKDVEDADDEEDANAIVISSNDDNSRNANNTAHLVSQLMPRSEHQQQQQPRRLIGRPRGQHRPLHFEHNRRGGWKGTEHWNYTQVPSHDIRCDNCDRFLTEVIALCPRRYRGRDSGAAVLQRCQGCHFSTCRLCFDARNFDPDVHPLCRISLDWGISRRIMTYMMPQSTPDPAPVIYSDDEGDMPPSPPLVRARTAAAGRKRKAASGPSSGRTRQDVGTAQTLTQGNSAARPVTAPRRWPVTTVSSARRVTKVPDIVVAPTSTASDDSVITNSPQPRNRVGSFAVDITAEEPRYLGPAARTHHSPPMYTLEYQYRQEPYAVSLRTTAVAGGPGPKPHTMSVPAGVNSQVYSSQSQSRQRSQLAGPAAISRPQPKSAQVSGNANPSGRGDQTLRMRAAEEPIDAVVQEGIAEAREQVRELVQFFDADDCNFPGKHEKVLDAKQLARDLEGYWGTEPLRYERSRQGLNAALDSVQGAVTLCCMRGGPLTKAVGDAWIGAMRRVFEQHQVI